MSREQRRMDRKAQARGGTPSRQPARRTPVKVSGGRRLPILPIGIAGGIVILVALIAYLILQSGGGVSASAAEQAAADQSSSIPGTYVPDQGRGHLAGGFTLTRAMIPFCPGVPNSGTDASASATTTAGTPAATDTPAPTQTPSQATASGGTPAGTPTVATNCHNSNPPSSGMHLNVQNNVDVGGGNLINIPPDPDVYPPEVTVPRDAIAHILEHAGVFVGYNCKDGDSACQQVVKQLTDLVNDRITNHNNRVVMARDADLVEGTIGMSSWTRVLDFKYQDYDKNLVTNFIAKNSCRVDWEGFCK